MTRVSIEFNHNWRIQWFVHFTTEWKWEPRWRVFDTDHQLMRELCLGFVTFETTATTKQSEEYYA